MKQPSIYTVESIQDYASAKKEINGKWVPARPSTYKSISKRIKITWGVFTGKYDALKWEDQ